MRLRRLHLERFGHFEDRALDFGEAAPGTPDFHVVHGPNEAGKTTLMEGYLRLLYGFRARSEPYDFRHGRPNLRVSAELKAGGATTCLTRLPARRGALVDGHGAPLPESALAGLLGGLGEAEYRSLLCLDDATIERGGEEILASRGDIGRLLFSAAAGLSDLSAILERAEAEAEALHRKGASKTTLAAQKRDLDAVKADIAAHDVSAADLTRLREALAAAEAEEAELRRDWQAAEAERARLDAAIEAAPLRDRRAAARAELDPLAGYPQALDIDPEALVQRITRRDRHAAERDRLAKLQEETEARRDALPAPAGLAALRPRLDDLRALRDRCAAAAGDLPRRAAEAETLRAEMAQTLAEIGVTAGPAPEDQVPAQSELARLDRLARAAVEAEAAAVAADEEAAREATALEEAEARRARADAALAALTDPAPVLERHGAERVMAEARAATDRLRTLAEARAEALDALALGPARFAVPPALPLSAAAAADLARRIAETRAEAARCAEAARSARAEADARAQALAALEGTAPQASDAAARAARAGRDAAWAAHRAALTRETADAFEAAMQADDALRDAREAAAETLGQIQEKRRTRDAAVQAAAEADAKAHAAETDAAAPAEDLRAQLARLGLPPETDAEAFAEWMRRAEAARDADAAHARAEASAAPARDAAEALRVDLCAALALDPATALSAAHDAALRFATDRREAAAAREAAGEASREATRQRDARMRRAEAAREARDAAVAARDSAAHAALGADAPALDEALPTLRRLREQAVALRGLKRQIDGMARDAETLASEIAPHAALLPEAEAAAELGPVALFDLLADAVAAEETREGERAALADHLAGIAEARAAEDAALADIDAETARLAEAFDPAIPTATLPQLRAAVLTARRAIDLRAEIATLETAICRLTGAPDAQAAETALAGLDLPAARSRRMAAQAEAERLRAALDGAIARRAEARRALREVTGGAEVAALATRRQTLELAMSDTLLRHLRLRFGHVLAAEAIRRYRDAHRSGMLRAAEAAFTALTNGAYSALRAEPAAGRETLVAIAADGTARQAEAMSKGTRFQLYLALRAAAYEQLAAGGTVLPFFCDDVFETFDEDRTRAACALMRRIAMTGQAIYLTHHAHVAEIAREVCGADLALHAL